MNTFIILLFTIGLVLFLNILIVAPKKLGLTLWPILMVYPHALAMGSMPFNAGFDDLYIVFLFIMLLFRLGLAKFDFPFKAVIIFYIIMFISNISGFIEVPATKDYVIRDCFKNLVFILFTAIVLVTIKDENDVRQHIIYFIISMILASVISIMDYFSIPFSTLFYVVKEGKLHYRATGAFLSPAGLGIAIQLPLFLCISGLAIRKQFLYKLIFAIGTGVFSIALLLSGSRSGWLAASIGLLTTLFISKRKVLLILIFIFVIIISSFVLGTETRDDVIKKNVDRTLYGSTSGTSGRLDIWLNYVSNPYFAMVFFGRGVYASQALGMDTPHNGYLDLIYLFGFGGFIYFCIIIYKMLKLSKWLYNNDNNELLGIFSKGIFISIFCWLGISIASDPPINTFWRYTIFFALCILWSRYKLLLSEIEIKDYE